MCFQKKLIRVCKVIQRKSQAKHRLRSERAEEIYAPLQTAQRAAKAKAKESQIERQAAHNAALAC